MGTDRPPDPRLELRHDDVQGLRDDGLGAIGAKHLKRAALRVFRLGERRVFPLADCPYCAEISPR